MENENKKSDAVSVAEIINGLEAGTLKPGQFTKTVLGECAIVMKSRGYTNLEIGQLLQVTPRTVQRYLMRAREGNSLIASVDYQKNFMNETVGNLSAQSQRLIRLSYSTEISDSDRIRAIFAACQVQQNMVAMLERLGYLGEGYTSSATQMANWEKKEKKAIAEAGALNQEMFQDDFNKLNCKQKHALAKFTVDIHKEAREKELELKLFLARITTLDPEYKDDKLQKDTTDIQDAANKAICKKLEEFLAELKNRNSADDIK